MGHEEDRGKPKQLQSGKPFIPLNRAPSKEYIEWTLTPPHKLNKRGFSILDP